VRTIFGDAAAATVVAGVEGDEPFLGPYVFGTDGSGANNLIVPAGGMRCPRSPETGAAQADEGGNVRAMDNLFMDGAEIFNFTLRVVPKTVSAVLSRAGKTLDDIDLFFFHQANQYMLDHLRKRLKIPEERFYLALKHCGNTVSSTIPIALRHALDDGALFHGKIAMLVGFGVGYSWGATLARW
jgi:3-oxoacyl-[acyl-carrier-protein] synthase-3